MATNQVNLEKICEPIFGITSRHYRRLEKDNVVPKITNGEIDFPLAVKMLLEYYRKLAEGQGSLSLTDERVRLTRINADRKALQLQREQGKLINTELAMKLWGAVIQIIKSKLESIPVKLAPLARATSSDMEAKEIIDKFIREVEEELANPDLKEVTGMVSDKPNRGHIKTSKKAHRKPMRRQRKDTKPRIKR